jgi:hypothetical protein
MRAATPCTPGQTCLPWFNPLAPPFKGLIRHPHSRHTHTQVPLPACTTSAACTISSPVEFACHASLYPCMYLLCMPVPYPCHDPSQYALFSSLPSSTTNPQHQNSCRSKPQPHIYCTYCHTHRNASVSHVPHDLAVNRSIGCWGECTEVLYLLRRVGDRWHIKTQLKVHAAVGNHCPGKVKRTTACCAPQ